MVLFCLISGAHIDTSLVYCIFEQTDAAGFEKKGNTVLETWYMKDL